MRRQLALVSIATLGLAALAAEPGGAAASVQRAHGARPLRRSVHNDPRALGLPAEPGSLPAGSAIAQLAADDPRFAAGMALFDRPFHAAEGVGAPEMNADSCRACHQDPIIGGAGGLELNVSRFGDDGGGSYPFQNLPGGQGASKLHPPWIAGREEHHPNATVFEQRQTPSILGAGLIDGIPDAVILAGEDPRDADGDGVFGVARLVDVGGVFEVGRFGWKAQAPRLADFVRDATGGELGLTTSDDGRGFALTADADGVPDPELTDEQADLLLHFMALLPAPARRDADDPEVAFGEALFASIGCAVCHVPELSGAAGPVPLYSDLLLHDVLPAGFRGMAEPGADVGFYRTTPLWGMRDTAPYLHDGRAADLAAAIEAHDGEAAATTLRYRALPVAEQAALLRFLRDL